LLAAIRASAELRLHCNEVAKLMGCDGRNVSARLSFALEHGLVHRVTEGRNTFYAEGPNPNAHGDDEVGDFEPILFGDGTLVLQNCPMTEEGVPQLGRAHARLVKRLLSGELL
jgi:hypothetical protein